MCKHILITNFDKQNDLNVIKSFNGRTFDNDGYGAIIRTKQNELITLKSLDKVSLYIDLVDIVNQKNVQELVVHHRTSTNQTGLDYAHPFEYKGYYLTHNGVVSLPKEYPNTKTTNDSEQLLHHLVESNFKDTESVSGYFSTFIMSHDKTMVLVDTIAPIYTDKRIYCSHQLELSWDRLQDKQVIIKPFKNKIKMVDIKTTPSNYGMNKASLSLGGVNYSYADQYDSYDDYYYKNMIKDNKNYYASTKEVDMFFESLSYNDIELLDLCQTEDDLAEMIKELAGHYGFRLNKLQVSEIVWDFTKYYSDKGVKNA